MRKLFKELYLELAPFGRFWFGLGMIALAAACAMSFFFGKSISMTHGVFLVVLSAVAAFGPHAAHKVFEMGKKNAGIALAILCAPLLLIEFYSHAGYTAGLRGVNLGDAKVQQAKYTGAQEAVGEDKTNLKLWQDRLTKLETENAWLPTVTATALRADIPAIDEAIRQETKRGGCGPKCLALKEKKAGIESKVALAEEKADLTTKLEATRKVLAKARDVASHTEFKHSSVGLQNEFLAKVVALVSSGTLKPDEFTEASAEQSVNLAMAVAGTGLPALCFFIAGCFAMGGRREHETNGRPEAQPAPTQITKLKSSVRDAYERHCRTYGVAPVAA